MTTLYNRLATIDLSVLSRSFLILLSPPHYPVLPKHFTYGLRLTVSLPLDYTLALGSQLKPAKTLTKRFLKINSLSNTLIFSSNQLMVNAILCPLFLSSNFFGNLGKQTLLCSFYHCNNRVGIAGGEGGEPTSMPVSDGHLGNLHLTDSRILLHYFRRHTFERLEAVSYTHLTLPTNREV